MLTFIREWMTSVVTTALLIAVVNLVIHNSTLKRVASLTCSLILLVSILQPLTAIHWEELLPDFTVCEEVIEASLHELEIRNQEAVAEEVAERTAAYIRQQAKSAGLDIEAKVKTEQRENQLPYPVSVVLSGPYDASLSDWITENLEISEEFQIWNEK